MGRIQFDPDGNGIVVFVTLRNGTMKRHIKMVVDTGSTFNMVPWHIAEELGYEPAMSNQYIPINTVNGQIHVTKIVVEETEALGKSAINCITLVHDLPETSRVSGLLGLSFLKNFHMTINFKEGTLELM